MKEALLLFWWWLINKDWVDRDDGGEEFINIQCLIMDEDGTWWEEDLFTCFKPLSIILSIMNCQFFCVFWWLNFQPCWRQKINWISGNVDFWISPETQFFIIQSKEQRDNKQRASLQTWVIIIHRHISPNYFTAIATTMLRATTRDNHCIPPIYQPAAIIQ